jgi:hypothetical protein
MEIKDKRFFHSLLAVTVQQSTTETAEESEHKSKILKNIKMSQEGKFGKKTKKPKLSKSPLKKDSPLKQML